MRRRVRFTPNAPYLILAAFLFLPQNQAPSLDLPSPGPLPLAATGGIRPTPSASVGAGINQSTTDAGWVESTWARIRRQEYEATVNQRGLQAPNRAQDLRTYFGGEKIEVVPREGEGASGWSFSWRTRCWGRRKRLVEMGPERVQPQADGTRVTYLRGDLLEWYENTEVGVEQGFSVEKPPAGTGPLVLQGTIGGSLRPVTGAEGQGIDLLNEHGVAILRYAGLRVSDARDREVPARMELSGRDVTLAVDDAEASYPLTVDPLIAAPAWTAEGNQTGARFGSTVTTAGDVNADGYSDVIVGAPDYDNGQEGEGRIYLFLGSSHGLSSAPGWTIEGEQAGAHLGSSLGPVGDVNGDGRADIIVGLPHFAGSQADEGRVCLYQGSPTGLSPVPSWSVVGEQAGALFGYSVGTAGDVNGDGYADVIVGAPSYDNLASDEGRACLYLGSPHGLAPRPCWTADGGQEGCSFGSVVGTAGDVNGDGYADVVVGAPSFDHGQTDEGRVFLYQGSSSGLSAAAAWTAEGDQAGAGFGSAVAAAGDVNGDGYADVLIGAPAYDGGEVDEGRAYLYQGSSGGLRETPSWTQEGNQVASAFGRSVGTAGDVNGDGYADVVIGAPRFDNGQTDEGKVFLFQGSSSGLATNGSWSAEGNQAGAAFGSSVGTAGDVDGDGYSDVIVGADSYDNGQTDEGGAFVFKGAAGGLPANPSWTTVADEPGAFFAHCVATAGDVNGDGYSDVIVGADGYDNGRFDCGRAYLFMGGPQGLSLEPAWVLDGMRELGYLGVSVGTAGDVNGDGYADVIVGAYRESNDQVEEGRAYLFLGSEGGLSHDAAWTVEGNRDYAWLGYSVATAGDVNGDGFSDVVVGVPCFADRFHDEGRIYLYLGSPTGLSSFPVCKIDGDQAEANLGVSVATAGDVNGDGYSDVIAGAYGYSHGQTEEGRALVFYGSPQGLSLDPAWSVEGNQESAFLGVSVGTAGDVNGDGYSDVLVGAYQYSNGQLREGRAYLFLGSPTGLPAGPAWTAESNQAFARLGVSVATAGDVNGDGYADVIVGAQMYTNDQRSQGRAYLFNGGPGGLSSSPSWIGEGNQADSYFGYSVATAGDVNGDGFSDVIVGADYADGDRGRAYAYYGNSGGGLSASPMQVNTFHFTPIGLLGASDSDHGFGLRVAGRTPAGRGKVRLEYEVKPLGTAFSGEELKAGPLYDTGLPGLGGSKVKLTETVGNLSPSTLYHWRLRTTGDSPFFPHSRWFFLPYNSSTESDVRTGSFVVGTPELIESGGCLRLHPGVPNPFTNSTNLTYTIPRAGRVSFRVYDASGREVAVLADGEQEPGWHTLPWDGTGVNGIRLPAGVYFGQLRFAGQETGTRLVLGP